MASPTEQDTTNRELAEPNSRDAKAVAQVQEALNSRKDFNQHIAVLKSRTALSAEDVTAQAVRFANAHRETFHDFIYKGDQTTPIQRFSLPGGQYSSIIAMTLLLVVLIAAIIVVGS